MLPITPREWLHPASAAQARDIQRDLAARVLVADEPVPPRTVAGVDVSNTPRNPDELLYAALAVLALPSLTPVATAGATRRADFPYVPGLLAFREAPCLLDAFAQLEALPDLLVVDGHGVSHPRGIGIASHLGVLLDRPSIGVAKTILVGAPEGEPGAAPGSWVPLVWKGRTIGAVLRTRARVSPVYVSVGHRVTLEGAVRQVCAMLGRTRLPEPTRQAHLAANVLRRGAEAAPRGAVPLI